MNAQTQIAVPNLRTPAELADIVRPFAGTGRSVHRGGSAIDVLHIMNSVDASVIEVDASGLTLNENGHLRVVAWGEVRSITVRGIADKETVAATVYENAAADWPVRQAVAA